jgi:CubicO group peptidase (beta-lactamase class C family)
MKKIIFVAAIFVCFFHQSFSQTKINAATTALPLQPVKPEAAGFSSERLKRIDNNIMQWVNDGHTTGAVALIVRNGKIVYHKAFGYDDLQKIKPMRTDNIFRLASQTKAITSVAVMMLYEEGKFLLDDPVSRYIPEFAKQQVLDSFIAKDSSYTTIPAKSEVTIRQLLTHTSGIDYGPSPSKEASAIFFKAGILEVVGVEPGKLLADNIKKIAKLPLMHQPGERFTYGLNTEVLGYLVEVTSGMSLDRFFKTRIFEPLGMNDTYFYLPPSKYSRLVTLHEEVKEKLQKADAEIKNNGIFITDYPKTKGTYFSGGTGLSSTAMDYAIFLQMMLNGGEFNGKRLLSRNTVRMMTMNQIGDINFGVNKFGLGFGITTEKGSSIIPTPEGVFEWAGGFATHYWADPKENLIGILYRQIWNTTQWEAGTKFKVLVYQALNE